MEDSIESVASRLERAADRMENAGFHESAAEMRASAAKLRMGASLDHARELERKHLSSEAGSSDPVEQVAARLDRAARRMGRAGFRDTAEDMITAAEKLRQGGTLEDAREAELKFLPEDESGAEEEPESAHPVRIPSPRSSPPRAVAGEYDPVP